MEIAQQKQLLERSFTEYENLQNLHLEVMKNEPRPDIARMTEDRDVSFNRLKQNINEFVGVAGSNGGKESLPVLAEFETRLKSIMDVSEELSKAILEYQKGLKKDIAKIKQSKAAMKGYKPANVN